MKRREHLATYAKHIRRYAAKVGAALDDTSTPIHSAHVPAAVRELFPAQSPLVADGGNTAVSTMFYSKAAPPARVLSTMKMGMLGAGMGQALGAAVAVPARPVACIIVDGAMGMHPQEIESAVRHQLHIVWLVLCDKQWGMVKMTQSMAMRPVKMLLKKRLDPGENIWCDFGDIDFAGVARAMGAQGERVNDPATLRQAIGRALAHSGPTAIHVHATFVDFTDAIDQIKAIKSDEQIGLIKKTAALQDEAIEYAKTIIRPVRRDFEIIADVVHKVTVLGSEEQLVIGGSGPLGKPVPMQKRHFQNRVIREGDQFTLMIEVNGPGGMYAEIGRVYYLGKVPSELKDAYDQCKETRKNTLKLLKPGADPGEIWRANNEFLLRKKQLPETRLFAHGQGYDL